MDIEAYKKRLDELLEMGLTIDEADKVINGSYTLEEALQKHQEKAKEEDDAPLEEVKMDTYEDAEAIMEEVRKITKERSE